LKPLPIKQIDINQGPVEGANSKETSSVIEQIGEESEIIKESKKPHENE
jgi:hypothetical protein